MCPASRLRCFRQRPARVRPEEDSNEKQRISVRYALQLCGFGSRSCVRPWVGRFPPSRLTPLSLVVQLKKCPFERATELYPRPDHFLATVVNTQYLSLCRSLCILVDVDAIKSRISHCDATFCLILVFEDNRSG